jgi:hypothetical protein
MTVMFARHASQCTRYDVQCRVPMIPHCKSCHVIRTFTVVLDHVRHVDAPILVAPDLIAGSEVQNLPATQGSL